MADAVLADPQGQNRLPIDGVRLNEAFHNALDKDAPFPSPEPPRPDEIMMPIEREVQAFDNALGIRSGSGSRKRGHEQVLEWDVAPRQAKFARHERQNEDLGSANAFLTDWQGQTPSAPGDWIYGADDTAQYNEITPGRSLSREIACRAPVAEPGSQTPGVAVNGVALCLPQLKLPSDNQGTTASGSHLQKISNEVSTGTNPWQHARQCTVYVMGHKY